MKKETALGNDGWFRHSWPFPEETAVWWLSKVHVINTVTLKVTLRPGWLVYVLKWPKVVPTMNPRWSLVVCECCCVFQGKRLMFALNSDFIQGEKTPKTTRTVFFIGMFVTESLQPSLNILCTGQPPNSKTFFTLETICPRPEARCHFSACYGNLMEKEGGGGD